MIGPELVAQTRALAEASMDLTVRIRRSERARSDTMETTLGPPQTVATVDGRVSEVKGKESVVAGQVDGVVEAVVRLPHDTDVRDGDQVDVDGLGVYNVIKVLDQAPTTRAQVKALIGRVG